MMGKNYPDTLEIGGPYLTVIPSRNPEKKVHKTLGHAKNALLAKKTVLVDGSKTPYGYEYGFGYDMAIYQMIDGEYKLLHEVFKKDTEVPW